MSLRVLCALYLLVSCVDKKINLFLLAYFFEGDRNKDYISRTNQIKNLTRTTSTEEMSEKFKVEINTALLNIYTFGFRLKLTNKKLWFKWSEAGLFTRFLIVLWYHVVIHEENPSSIPLTRKHFFVYMI